jgi:hypothetical protein
MYPLSGEYGLVTNPFLPGTGIPYRKSSPFFETALVAVRMLRSSGGAFTPVVSAGAGLGDGDTVAVTLLDLGLVE